MNLLLTATLSLIFGPLMVFGGSRCESVFKTESSQISSKWNGSVLAFRALEQSERWSGKTIQELSNEEWLNQSLKKAYFEMGFEKPSQIQIRPTEDLFLKLGNHDALILTLRGPSENSQLKDPLRALVLATHITTQSIHLLLPGFETVATYESDGSLAIGSIISPYHREHLRLETRLNIEKIEIWSFAKNTRLNKF